MRLRTRKGYLPIRYPLSVQELTLDGFKSKVIRRVGQSEGERMVNARKAVRTFTGENHVGYELLKAPEPVKHGPDANMCSISANEVRLIAGQAFKRGRSRTLSLPEHKRAARAAIGLPRQDAVELAVLKLENWGLAR